MTIFSGGAVIEESDEGKPGVILDYDMNGNVVGMESSMPASAWKTRVR